MSAVGGGNYISDGALLAWATQQQNRLYGDLQDTMHDQELQGQMASDLADLKKHLEDLVKHPENAKDVDAELIAFGQNYGGNPQFNEVTSSVAEIETVVKQYVPATDAAAAAIVAAANAVTHLFGSKGSSLGTSQTSEPPPALTQETVKDWTKTLDEKLSASGINQQLGMVHINEIKSTIDQGTQLTSQMIKSSNDSMDSVINNIA
jgi:hypothetical protein